MWLLTEGKVGGRRGKAGRRATPRFMIEGLRLGDNILTRNKCLEGGGGGGGGGSRARI